MIAWTSDGLALPLEREVVDDIVTGRYVYQLMHDDRPTRWYIARLSGTGLDRTVVYGHRNAPALKQAWSLLKEGKAA